MMSCPNYRNVTLMVFILLRVRITLFLLLVGVVCLLGIASPQVGLPGPYDFVNRSLTKREVNISAQSLRLPWTRHGMLHVMDTHTHHRIYSVTCHTVDKVMGMGVHDMQHLDW